MSPLRMAWCSLCMLLLRALVAHLGVLVIPAAERGSAEGQPKAGGSQGLKKEGGNKREGQVMKAFTNI